MGFTLLFYLLAIYQWQFLPIKSEIVELPRYNVNGADPYEIKQLAESTFDSSEHNNSIEQQQQTDTQQLASSNIGSDEKVLELQYPIVAMGVDYGKNIVTLRLEKAPEGPEPKLHYTYDPKYDDANHNSLEHNFMRFGKRQPEELPNMNSIEHSFYYNNEEPGERFERSTVGERDSRGDNFMRFGRNPKSDFMRFGRNPKSDFIRFGRNPKSDFMRFGRNPKGDFMRFGRNPKVDFMRFGRNPKGDFMRFGRDPKDDFMRFGRNPKEDFMRFGRNPKEDFMRFGRSPKEDFMRFGRSPKEDFMRFGRNRPMEDFMRFGRPDTFMRFGKSVTPELEVDKNQTKPLQQKNELKEAAKILKQAERESGSEETNPMDQAIKVLFHKQQQQAKNDLDQYVF